MSLTFSQLQDRLDKSVQRTDLAPNYGEFINEALRETQNRRSWACMKATTFVTISPGVLTSGGNLVHGNVALVGGGPNSFAAITGFVVGAQYFFKAGTGETLMTAHISGTIAATDGNFFTATQTSYYIVADISRAGSFVTSAIYAPGLNQVAKMPANFKELQKRPAIHYVADDGGYIPAEVVYEWQQIFRVWAFGGTPVSTWPPRIFFEGQGADSQIGLIEPMSQAMIFRVKYYGYLADLVNDADTSPLANLYPKLVLAKAKAIAFTEINDGTAAEQSELEFEKKLAEAIRQDAYSEVAGRDLRL